MELKKDSNAVSIDMLLIVHSEKRRAAQSAHPSQLEGKIGLPRANPRGRLRFPS